MPHFGRSIPINTRVKKLLVFFHDGSPWIGNLILVDVELIALITCPPFTGIDPTPLLRTDQEASITAQMKEKYDVVRENKGF